MDGSWPADHAAIGAAKRFVAAAAGRVVVASHHDVDGLSAAVIMTRTLAAAGAAVQVLPGRRGEHVHQDAMRHRICLPFTPSPGSEYANGHPRATGGSLSIDDFERFLKVLRARTGAPGGLAGSGAGRPHR